MTIEYPDPDATSLSPAQKAPGRTACTAGRVLFSRSVSVLIGRVGADEGGSAPPLGRVGRAPMTRSLASRSTSRARVILGCAVADSARTERIKLREEIDRYLDLIEQSLRGKREIEDLFVVRWRIVA